MRKDILVGAVSTTTWFAPGSTSVWKGSFALVRESETALLMAHLKRAITRFETEGFTVAQQRALIKNPGLADAYRGNQIDAFFKESVQLDPKLGHLEITPRFKFGPDVFDPAKVRWWDLTTPGEWQKHAEKYWLFGDGTPIFTK